ncbi:hypothetical protein Tco_1128878 [Tanacetum coccineum]
MMILQQADMGEGKPKKVTEIPQSSEPTTLVADETIHKERGDSVERAATTATSLDAAQDSGNIYRTQSTTMPNDPLPKGMGSGGRPRRQETIGDRPAQTRFEILFKQSNDPPLLRVNTLGSGDDNIKLKELMELCTKLSERVLDLETTKTAQAQEIASLKKRVKKLKKRKRSRTPGMTLFKIGTSKRSSLGEEDASKQGRNLKQGKQRSTFKESDVDEDLDNAVMDEAIEHVYEADKDVEGDTEQVSAAAVDVSTGDAVNTAGTEVNTTSVLVTTVGISVTTAEPSTSPTTTTVFEDEDLTIAQTLVKMKSEKSKVRGMIMKEPSETATRPTVPPQQHDPKEKAELEEEERLANQREEDANIAEWDNVQAMIDADYELAARLQAEEQGELTIEERSRLFMELIDKRKKYFARLRAEEKRIKPLTKAQKMNQMCTYLKNMAGFTHNQLKKKSFVEVQKAFDKTISWIDSFIPMDFKVVKDRAEGSETRVEGSSKSAGEDFQQKSTKKQKVDDDDKEKEDLKRCFEIVPAEEVAINAIPLATKPTPIGRIVGIKRLLNAVEVTTAGYSFYLMSVQKLRLLVEVTTAQEVQGKYSKSLSKAHLLSLTVDPLLAYYTTSKLQVLLSVDNPFQPA